MRTQHPTIAFALLVCFIGPTLAQKPVGPSVDRRLPLMTTDPSATKAAWHWSFKRLERPVVPDRTSAWIRSPIDTFMLSQVDGESRAIRELLA